MKKTNFNWRVFHRELDFAVATMISEEDILPSKISLLEFLEYCGRRQKDEKKQKILKDSRRVIEIKKG